MFVLFMKLLFMAITEHAKGREKAERSFKSKSNYFYFYTQNFLSDVLKILRQIPSKFFGFSLLLREKHLKNYAVFRRNYYT